MNCSLAVRRYSVRITILCLLCGSLHAQWSRNPSVNTLVTGAKGNQTAPVVVSDGASGAIISWQDTRDSATRGVDLYTQRINSRGIAQWTANGVVISTSTGNQIAPTAVSDGRGGIIVVWQDTRNGNSDIFAQHVGSDSTKLWTANGIPICTEGHEQTLPVIAPDNLGGAFIVWQDYRNANADLYAQHINSGGTILWATDGVPVVTSANDQILPSIISDGNSGAIVTWQDLRNGSNFDIYAQKLQSTGSPAWTANGVAVSTSANQQLNPVLTSDGALGAFIAWEDYRNDIPNIYLQKLTSTGAPAFTANGIAVSASGFSQNQPRIIQDGLGGAIVCWTDLRNGDSDIFAQRLNNAGTSQWASGGLSVCASTGSQKNPGIVTDGYNGAIVAWEDYRNSTPDIYAQRVLSNGSLLWAINGVGVATQSASQTLPAIVENSSHGAIITWQDARNAGTQGYDIYAQLINDIGTLGGYSIHGYLFSDNNRNGTSDTDEPFLPNWTINLSGPTSKTATTDSSGSYSFDGLPTGIYTIQPQIKPGWILTATPDSIVNLSIGGDSVRNYPLFQLGTISVFAYKDVNHDGVYQTSDSVDPKRTIRITGAAAAQVVTDDKGNATFVGLPVGTFYMSEDPSAGTIPTTSPAVDTIRIDTLGQDMAGYSFGSFVGAVVTGKVYNDLKGDSALSGDSLINAWEVRLFKGSNLVRDTLTNSSGVYLFAGIDSGKYVVHENLVNGWFQTYPKPPGDTVFSDDSTRGYKISVVTGGTRFNNKDFGNFRGGVITGRVFNDVLADSDISGDGGLAGWCVRLYSAGKLIGRQYTDASGIYRFNSLGGGGYTIEESLATGYRQTYPRLLTPKYTATVYGASAGPRAYRDTITNGNTLTLNFANFRYGRIRGSVHVDIAGDSIIAGDPVIPGWTVRLTQGTSTRDVKTGIDGEYLFSNVDAGSYIVQEIEAVSAVQTYPRVSMPNVVIQKTARCYKVTIDTSGEFDDALDFGVSTGCVTGTVFGDQNGDGLREDGETGVANVVIHLQGKATDSTTSDALGNFYFVGLDTGSYSVSEDLPSGWIRTCPKSPGWYSFKLTTSSRYRPNNDFGNFQQGVIGGTLYYDRDANYQRDPRDVGLAGWKVYLSGTLRDSSVTATDGSYRFAGLPLGLYWVKIKRQSGWMQTNPPDSVMVTVTSGGSFPQTDFGVTGLAKISGTVRSDLNRNGVRDPSDVGIPGVRLIAQIQSRIDTTLSDSTGAYQFSNLGPGVYTIRRNFPSGWLHTFPITDSVYTLSLPASASLIGEDFLDFALGTISGVVFADDNANGSPDSLEHGIAGITLTISGGRTDSVVTGSDGVYQFANLDTGKYVVQERSLPFVARSVPAQGNSYSDAITAGGQVRSGRNFGHFQNSTISGIVFSDMNANGSKDQSDPLLTGWRIHLHNVDVPAATDSVLTTLSDGVFQFTGVAPGRYVLAEETPAGWYQTSPALPDTITMAAGQQVAGKSLGNYYALFTGRTFNDLNGDGVSDAGEPGRSGIRLYLVRNGTVVDSTISDSQGVFTFRNRGLGTYILTETADPVWVQTLSPAPINLTQPSGSIFTNLNFGDFRRFSISGYAFQDVNRNGVMDGGESGLIQCIISMKRNGIAFAIDTSLSDGSYAFANLGPGVYALSQQLRTGYQKSAPLSPDTFFVTGQSGSSVGAKNFGNYLNVTRSITARVVSDLDGALSTPGDRTPKPWWIGLYRTGTLLKSVIGSALDTANLPTGTYVVQVADSSSGHWSVLGQRRTIHRSPLPDSIIQKNGPMLSDTIVLGSGDSNVEDFVVTNYGTIVVRSLADADARIDTVADRSGLVRTVELYRNFMAPGNLVASATDSLTTVGTLGSGTYVIRQIPSDNWQTIGTSVNGKYRTSPADTVVVVLGLGTLDTIGFVNGGIGSIVARNITDDDGDTLTVNDQQFSPWGFSLYKWKDATKTRVDTVYAESLAVRHLVGTYILRRARVSSWTPIRTFVDDTLSAPQDTFVVTVTGGDSHYANVVVASSRRLRTWSSQVDARWENRFNWTPAVLPTSSDSVLIRGDRPWRSPRFPAHSAFSSVTIDAGAGALLPSSDSVLINGELLINGALQADPATNPVLVVNGDILGSGAFTPGNSIVTITSDLPRSLMGGHYATLNIGGPAVSISGSRRPSSNTTNRLLGSSSIANRLELFDNLNELGDTITIGSDAWDALHGAGTITAGSILRVVHAGESHPYRFWEDSTYIRFDPSSQMPASVIGSVLSDTSPTSFGVTWDSLGSVIDTVNRTVKANNITSLASRLPFTLGCRIGGEWKPVIRRIYFFEATPESGFSAALSLQYQASDVPAGIPQASLRMVRLRLVQKDVDYPLFTGWNMVSLPVTYADSRKSILYPAAISDAFCFEPGSGYLTEDSMSPGTGYWLRFGSAGTYHYTGIERRRDSIPINPGWNLIGSISYLIPAGNLKTSPAGILHGPIFGLANGYTVATTIVPGSAYWVNSTAAGVLVLDTAVTGTGKAVTLPALPELNQITVVDAAGHRQLLQFGESGNSSSELYRLPPLPPAGVFDVRFSTNSTVALCAREDDNNVEFHIVMQGVTLPVTLSWVMQENSVRPVTIQAEGEGKESLRTLGRRGSFRIEDEAGTHLLLTVRKGMPLPTAFSLRQCYPNPFNPTTRIEFDLPEPALVTMKVYDILGREVATVIDRASYAAGAQSVVFDGRNLASGVYFYRIEAHSDRTSFHSIKKMMLMK